MIFSQQNVSDIQKYYLGTIVKLHRGSFAKDC